MIPISRSRRSSRRAFRPELGALEGRELMTQLGAVAPRAAGVVHVQNNHPKPGTAQGLGLSLLAGTWQGRYWYTKFGSEQLGRPHAEGDVQMVNTLRGSVLTIDEYRPDTQIRNRFEIHRTAGNRFYLQSNLDNHFDEDVATPKEPGRQIGPNSWTFQVPLKEHYPGPFEAYRRNFTLINRDVYSFTVSGLRNGQWDVLLIETMHRVPATTAL